MLPFVTVSVYLSGVGEEKLRCLADGRLVRVEKKARVEGRLWCLPSLGIAVATSTPRTTPLSIVTLAYCLHYGRLFPPITAFLGSRAPRRCNPIKLHRPGSDWPTICQTLFAAILCVPHSGESQLLSKPSYLPAVIGQSKQTDFLLLFSPNEYPGYPEASILGFHIPYRLL